MEKNIHYNVIPEKNNKNNDDNICNYNKYVNLKKRP
jgi:hypothetical protein